MPHRKTLSDIIKPGKMISLPPEAPAALAARKMLECQVGAVLVQVGGDLLGIVTERDIQDSDEFRATTGGSDTDTAH